MRQGFDVSINDYNRNLFTVFKTVLEQKDGESPAHVLLKVLAATLYYDPGIVIEPNDVDPQYRPDLLIRRIDGFPATWIECGNVRTVKLDKLTSRYVDAQVVVVKKIAREIRDLKERCEKDVRRPYNLTYVAFDKDFVDRAASHVMGRNDCTAIISDNTLQFLMNGFDATTPLHRESHEAKDRKSVV